MNIRKISIKIFASLLLVSGLVGCNDQMDTDPSTGLDDKLVLRSTTNLNMLLQGVYRDVHFGRSGSTVYRGVAGLCMYPDLSGNDIVMSPNIGSGPHLSVYLHAPARIIGDETSGLGWQIWYDMYNLINTCNIIIDNIESSAGDAVLRNDVWGQALAIRGYCYFQLIQNFQKTYSVAKDRPGVILRTSFLDSYHKGRATVEQVYTQITDDLTLAKTKLENFNRGIAKNYIDKYVIAGLLARVYLVMGEGFWDKCEAEADFAYQAFSTLMTREQFRSGFANASYPEIIWATYQFADLNMGWDNQRAFWGNQPDFTTPAVAYTAFFANKEYEKLFDATEDRYQFRHRTDINTDLWAYEKWFELEVDAKRLGDIPLMRGAEMLLMRAEAKANQGNTTGAREDLNTLQAARAVPAAKMTTTTDKFQLLEAIYTERRKELLGEGVTGTFDLLRLNRPLMREGDHRNDAGVNIPANDYRFICQIPYKEMDYNDALSDKDQNPMKN